MNAQSLITISRRTTLRWLAGAAAVSGLAYYTVSGKAPPAQGKSGTQPTGNGYGTDPDLQNPSVPWGRTLSAQHLQMTAVLADIFLPATADSPKASALGIQDFVDEWVSAPYPEQQKDRRTILEGLHWLDAESGRRWQRSFIELDDRHRHQLMEAIVPKSAADASAQHTFFRRFRHVVAGAYYTTAEGAKNIGYVGNVPLPNHPPITDKEKAVLNDELRKLGIV